MEAPDKIYIDEKDVEIPSDYYAFSMPPYINHKYIEYIRKDAVVELVRDCMRGKPAEFQLDVQAILDRIIAL